MKEPISIKVLKLTSKSTSKKFRFNSSDSYSLKLEMHWPVLVGAFSLASPLFGIWPIWYGYYQKWILALIKNRISYTVCQYYLFRKLDFQYWSEAMPMILSWVYHFITILNNKVVYLKYRYYLCTEYLKYFR